MSGYVSGRLRGYVHVTDDDGHSHVYGPSTEVPEWAARKITNRRAWATQPTIPAPTTGTGQDVDASGQDDAPPAGGEVPARPPKSGKGAGRPEWAAYATARGVTVEDDDDRAAIQSKVEKRDAEDAEDAAVSGQE